MPTGCVAGTEKQGIFMNQHIWWIDITQVWVTSNTAYTWCRERERGDREGVASANHH